MDKETKELLEALAKDRSLQVNINCSDVSFIKVPESVAQEEPRMPAASQMTRERFTELYRLLTGEDNYINPTLSLMVSSTGSASTRSALPTSNPSSGSVRIPNSRLWCSSKAFTPANLTTNP